MKDYFEKSFQKKKFDEENDDDKKRRIILYIIILIIIILLLLTSCSCSSKFFGTIGDLFKNEETYNINDDTNDTEVVKNQELQFDTDFVEMSLSDSRMKLSFTYKNINPTSFTCSTSNAEIATCYVSNDYVVIIPKSPGEVTVTLQTTTNGKIYEATAQVVIEDVNRKIELSSTSGTINLASTKYKTVTYSLSGLTGNITVTSSNPDIATAVASDGLLKITANRTGKVTFVLSLTYNDMVYTAEYTLTVENKLSGSGSSGGSGSTSKPGGDNMGVGDGESPTNPSNPSNPSNPTEPTNPNPGNPENPVYDVTLKSSGIYYLEDHVDNPYYLEYEVLKDGIPTDDKVDIVVSSNISYELVESNGQRFIKIIPNGDVKTGDTATVKITSHGVTTQTTIQFRTHNYDIKINPTEYYLSYTEGSSLDTNGSKTFIIQAGNLFTGTLQVSTSGNTNDLSICSNDAITCIRIKVKEGYEDKISVSYGSDSSVATSGIPIKVTLSEQAINDLINGTLNLDEAFLEITASSSYQNESLKINGNELETIKFKITTGHIVTIYAYNDVVQGFFTNGATEIQIPLSGDETLNLADYIAYGITSEGSCTYYPLMNYNTSSNGIGGDIYSLDAILTGNSLTSNLTLYAIYDGNGVDMSIDPLKKRLYLTDVEIFHNEAYLKKFGKDYVVYPGAQGSYIITLFNNSSSELVINGLSLIEDTICVERDKCLNMGYIVHYSNHNDINTTNRTYYYGGKNDAYTILNKDANISGYIPNGTVGRSYSAKKIEFNTADKPVIRIPKGEGIEISLLWKWMEVDDEADTAVGVYASEHADGINNLYTLTVGFDFSQGTTCGITKTE